MDIAFRIWVSRRSLCLGGWAAVQRGLDREPDVPGSVHLNQASVILVCFDYSEVLDNPSCSSNICSLRHGTGTMRWPDGRIFEVRNQQLEGGNLFVQSLRHEQAEDVFPARSNEHFF